MTTSTPQDIWKSFALSAEHICLRIESERPDLILVLYKSGSLMWQAVNQWWAATRDQPYPPLIGVNLGPHIYRLFHAEEYEFHDLQYGSDAHVGFAIAWVLEHEEWRLALQQRIQAVLNESQPSRILVIDDVIAEGRASVLVLSLLWSLFPCAHSSVCAGLPFDWREVLGASWYSQSGYAPPPYSQPVWEPCEELTKLGINLGVGFPWQYLVSGLANSETDVLGWQPLTSEHSLLRYLARSAPEVDWLAFPHWVQQSLSDNLKQWLTQRAMIVQSRQIVGGWPWLMSERALQTSQQIAALAWMNPGVTLAEIADHCCISTQDAEVAVKSLLQNEDFETQQVNGVTRYFVSESVDLFL